MVELPTEARDAIRALVHDLVLGRFTEIERERRIGRLTADELKRAVTEYGRTLIDLPGEAWPLIDTHAVSDTTFSVDVPMWTKEEGRSDLTLSVSVEIHGGTAQVSIDDLHVL